MSIDSRQFRHALGSFATGVTIITTRSEAEGDIGVTANSFNSVSIDPPLVLWSLSRSSRSIDAFRTASHFAVHILASDQKALSDRFATSGTDKFAALEVGRGAGGTPLLEGCNARFQCRSAYQYEGGDHVIFVGEVLAYEHRSSPPLLYYAGRYASAIESASESAHDGSDLSHLLQRAYFQLLTPVRDERDRLKLGLHDHYVLGVLMDGPRTIDDVEAMISYSGLHASSEQAENLIARGLVEALDRTATPTLRITPAGQHAVVRLAAAARAIEAEAVLTLEPKDLGHIKRLLKRISQCFGATPDAPVIRHMDVLAQQLR